MSQKSISLTGIKPTGTAHLGNYFGAIQPAIKLSYTHDSYLFIADYHALTTEHSSESLNQSIIHVAATWLACGLDPEQCTFYRQSDIPEIFELNWILSCMASKGLINRAHAYKSLTDQNIAENRDPDFHINLGIFSYPVLMAADILAFQAIQIPVGQDQKQHVEIARDICETLIKKYPSLTLKAPEPVINSPIAIPGTDGRKMSKSYGNVIPIFGEPKKIRKIMMKLKTDSKGVEEPKDPDQCLVFQLYKQIAEPDEIEILKQAYLKGGLGYGHAKERLFESHQKHFQKAQETYESLIQNPDTIYDILAKGAEKARPVAAQTLNQIKSAIGIK